MRTAILITLGVLLCATATFGQQTPPLYVPYQPPAAPPQYAQQASQPVQPPVAQPMPQQAPAMYDNSYSGPMNVYGQPVFSMGQRAGQQAQNPQTIHNGLIPQAARGLYGAGTYLWGYMPAPVRGATSPYEVPPGAGHVSVTFVPGASR